MRVKVRVRVRVRVGQGKGYGRRNQPAPLQHGGDRGGGPSVRRVPLVPHTIHHVLGAALVLVALHPLEQEGVGTTLHQAHARVLVSVRLRVRVRV